MGWGSAPWGTSPWGFGTTGLLFLTGAYPSSIRSIVVGCSRPPRALSALGIGDALNPATWTVTVVNTAELLLVYAVRMLDAGTAELFLLQPMGGYGTQHTVGSTTLITPAGVVINYPRLLAFNGTQYADALKNSASQVDLQSRQVPGGTLAATLVVTSAGDYANEGGDALLKKIIIRQLSSQPGDWTFSPQFGLGLRTKYPLSTRDIPTKEKEMELVVQSAPEVDTARVSISYNPSTGILVANIQARTRAGANVETNLSIGAR